MAMPTAEEIVSLYLFGQSTPPANLKTDQLIDNRRQTTVYFNTLGSKPPASAGGFVVPWGPGSIIPEAIRGQRRNVFQFPHQRIKT